MHLTSRNAFILFLPCPLLQSYRELARRVRVHASALTVIQRPSHRNRTNCIEYVRVDPERGPEKETGVFQGQRRSERTGSRKKSTGWEKLAVQLGGWSWGSGSTVSFR